MHVILDPRAAADDRLWRAQTTLRTALRRAKDSGRPLLIDARQAQLALGYLTQARDDLRKGDRS